MRRPLHSGEQVMLRRPTLHDEAEFLALMRQSAALHHPWVYPPITPAAYRDYLDSRRLANEDGFLVIERESGCIAGVINLNVITRGALQSAYLGYYAGQPFAGRGLMQEGLNLVIATAFRELGLHRLEANIQPNNQPSRNLVQRCGFHQEGYSPKYLRINGVWRDHERWAILNEV